MSFSSFWMAGFESAGHINRRGERLDMVAATQHDRLARHDYRRLRPLGIAVVREGVRWPVIERQGGFDFSTLLAMLSAARAECMQVNWNLCHYGWPDGLDVFTTQFVNRFGRYARAAAQVLRDHSDDIPCYTFINEISFLAWAAGECGGFIHPHAAGRGDELKRQLVRAAIAGIEAVRDVDARARLLHVDPIIHVVPRRGHPEAAPQAAQYTEAQHEAWDLLAGRLEPSLGGREEYLDLMGFNFYHSNEWEHSGERLKWEQSPRDERWVPLHKLLAGMWARYRRPVVLAETSHFGVGRGPWIAEIGDEIVRGLAEGVPIEGVCLYPAIDRPDWEDSAHWHNSGVWNLSADDSGILQRTVDMPYWTAIKTAQAKVAAALARRSPAHPC